MSHEKVQARRRLFALVGDGENPEALYELLDPDDNARVGVARNRSGHPYKPSAIRSYEKALRLRVLPVLGHLRVRELTIRDVQRFVDGLVRARWEPATIGVCVTALGSLYRHAVARGDAAINPTRGIEKPAVRSKERRIVAPEMAEALLAALPAEHRPLWATAFYAGLRKGELIGLRWDDVDLAAGVLHVRHSWDPKEGDIDPKSRRGTRDVPIPAVLREYLIELRLDATGQRVFGSANVVRRHAQAATRRWCELDLPDLTLHEARHTYASTMIAAGVNAKALSAFMGHGSIGITYDLYGHLMPGAEDEAAGLLDAFLARQLGAAGANLDKGPDQAGGLTFGSVIDLVQVISMVAGARGRLVRGTDGRREPSTKARGTNRAPA